MHERRYDSPGGSERRFVRFGDGPVSIEDLVALAYGGSRPALSDDPAWRERLEQGRRALAGRVASGGGVYGLTTGVGASLGNRIDASVRDELGATLPRLHGCGTGRILDEQESAAVVVARIATLVRGFSAVRPALVERLVALLDARLLPCIPAEGSVGASGDLTPLSYLASAVAGEREVFWKGQPRPAREALAALGLEPLGLEPREALALMNGTSAMTGLACLAWWRAEAFARTAAALTAMVSEATLGNPAHFDARLFAAKPHPGSVRVALWLRSHLEGAPPRDPARLQDRYSIRCAPQVIGVLVDALASVRAMLEIELNGVDDNPLVDPERGDVLHGGNFYGGHVCFAMDGLKSAAASVADLLDRQMVLLCCPETSGGLPENLVRVEGSRRFVHHGFKAMQITASALTAEAQKLTMPAAAFSRSTESHNQDKVSLGTIAARDALRVMELCEGVAAILVIAACQALDLAGPERSSPRSRAILAAVREAVDPLGDDRRQDIDIAKVVALLRSRALPFGFDEAGAASAASIASAAGKAVASDDPCSGPLRS
ncbi:histidine ammonia-lyase [Myxococcaceae bacterium]|nr:histidine ammonia-lyase [Myxococcaceae bacterium]